MRGRADRRELALIFTGHEYAEGAATILDALDRRRAHGSFFLTGGFLANGRFSALVRRMVAAEHYLGPHSDGHLLYCSWDDPPRLLVDRDAFRRDLQANLDKLERFGVGRGAARYFVPPYEHYNRQIVDWAAELGLAVVNLTPGTRSASDYTGEAERGFVSSQNIFESILARARSDPHGLNGFLLLMHVGAGPGRNDKFHHRVDDLLAELARQGYRFLRVDELLTAQGADTTPAGP